MASDIAPSAPPPPSRSPHRAALPPGTRVGRYVIVQEAGSGGMGAVYVAWDTQLTRRVAIKVVRPGADTPDARAKLLAEAQAMARLTHPNVVAIYDVGPIGDDIFLAMEYVDGPTLREWLSKPHPWREVLTALETAGRGLAAAHAVGLVHRDFKPDNVFMGRDGRVRVGDFGIARAEEQPDTPEPGTPGPATSAFTDTTQTGSVLGTAGYMAPERAFDGRDDARSDQFGFCATLYLALYGRHAFEHKGLNSYLEALGAPARPPPPHSAVPTWIAAIVMRGLELEPAARFASMEALLEALSRDPGPRRRWRVGTGAVVGLAALAALALGTHRRAQARACQDEGGVVAATAWSAEAEQTARAAFLRSDVVGREQLWEQTRASLEDYARRWSDSATAACRATAIEHTQSATVLHERRACLRVRLAELTQVTRSLREADAQLVNRAPDVVASLTPLDACSDPDELLATRDAPSTPANEEHVTDLRTVVAEARALAAIDHDVEAHERVTPVVEEARRIGSPPLLAEALVLQGRTEPRSSDAERVFVDAFRTALSARRFVVAGRAAAELTAIVGYTEGRSKEGHAWARLGEATLGAASSPDADDVRTTILTAETRVYNAEGDAPHAIESARRAIEVASRRRTRDDGTLEALHAGMGIALVTAGDVEGSRREFEAALASAENRFGRDHPKVADYLTSLATIEIADARYDVAVEELDRAIAMDSTTRGAGHVNTAIYLLDRAQANRMRGRCPEALADVSRANRLYVEAQGPDFGDLLITDTIAADCQRALGHPVEATAAITEAERIAAASSDADPEALAEMRFVRAELLSSRDPGHALELARQAREHFAVDGKTRSDRAWLETIDAWIASRARG